MATNYIEKGESMYLVTISGAESGDAFVVGDYLPCVLLTDADASDSEKAAVATGGVFKLAAGNTSGEIIAGDILYWEDKDSVLTKDSTKKVFGIALEGTNVAEAEILVLLQPRATIPGTVDAEAIASNAVITAKIMDANVTLGKLHGDVAKYISRAIDDPGDGVAIPVTASGVCAMTTTEGTGETRTLAIPGFIGQQLTLTLDVDGGDCVVTVAENVDGTNNTLTMDTAGDTIMLVGTQVAGALIWRIAANEGVGLSNV